MHLGMGARSTVSGWARVYVGSGLYENRRNSPRRDFRCAAVESLALALLLEHAHKGSGELEGRMVGANGDAQRLAAMSSTIDLVRSAGSEVLRSDYYDATT